MKHIDLFSGIGGFALAVDRVWPGSEHIFCDFDPFCQQVLNKHWPNSKIHDDIRTFAHPRGTQSGGLPNSAWEEIPESWIGDCILTGGFPCQPFSAAGLRKGTEDDRHLWPEMFRVIQFAKPTWVIAENVRGLTTWNEGMVLEQVCTDLESEGYEVQPIIIPAVAVNAPHRRDRIWIIANRTLVNEKRPIKNRSGNGEPETQTGNRDRFTPNSGRQRRFEGANEGLRSESEEPIGQDYGVSSWSRSWVEVASELCRVDDGLPAELDGLKLSKPAHRNQRLKSLGNAIVPQVAEQIMKAIDGI